MKLKYKIKFKNYSKMFGNNEKIKQIERIRTLKLNLNPKLNYHNQRVRKNHFLISLKIIEYNSNKFS